MDLAVLMCIVFIMLGAGALAEYIPAKLKEYSVATTLKKTLVSVFFILTAVAALFVSHSSFGLFVLAGLVFGLIGDIMLDLKFVYPRDDTVYTYAGFISFAAGHACYITGLLAFYADFSRPLYFLIPAAAGIGAGFFAGYAGEPLLDLKYGKMRNTVTAYGSILFAMMFISIGLAVMNGFNCITLNMMSVGAVLFAVSDLVLSGTYFGQGKDGAPYIIANYLTYYPAQFIIALAVACAVV